MKRLKKIALWSLGSIIGFVLLLILLAVIFEDRIKQYAVDELNEHLNVKVTVDDIELSFIKSFPKASLTFKNVHIPDAFPDSKNHGTLLNAKSIYMKLDIWDVLSGKYEVKQLEVEDAEINIKTDLAGNNNFDIFKPSPESNEEEKFTFDLENVKLKNVKFTYKHALSQQDYDLKIKQGNLVGNFGDKDIKISGSSNMKITHLTSDSLSIIKNKKANLDLAMRYDTEKNILSFKKSKLNVAQLNMLVDGDVYIRDTSSCNLNIRTRNANLKDVFSTLPSQYFQSISAYKTEGTVHANADIIGNLTGVEMPMIAAQISYENGKITEPHSGLILSKVNFRGDYSNRNQQLVEQLNCDHFSAQFPNGQINGKFQLEDFIDPKLLGEFHSDVRMEELNDFLKIEDIERTKGKLEIHTEIVGETHIHDGFQIKSAKGKIHFSELDLKLKSTDQEFKNASGDFVLKQKDAAIKDLKFNLGKSTLNFDGAFKNLLPFILFKDEKLEVIANLESSKLNLLDVLVEDKNSSAKTNSGAVKLPENIKLNLAMNIKELDYGAFHCKNMRGKFFMLDNKILAKNLSCKLASGALKSNLELEQYEKGFILSSNSHLSALKMNELLPLFENFGQTMVLPENIRGKLYSDVEFACHLSEELEVENKSILSTAKVKIEDGALIKLPIMKEITGYFKSKKSVDKFFGKHIDALDAKLQNIQFKTLSNEIKISNENVSIPHMDIESNALDISLSGEHDFSNNMDYRFNFRFKDLKIKEEYTEYGKVEDDGTGVQIFMRMFGHIDDLHYEMDKEERKQKRKKDIEEEKGNLKSILKENLGLFKKDSTVQVREKKKKTESEFILYDGELEEKEANPEKVHKKDNEKSNKFRSSKFYKKLVGTKPEEDKVEVQFEDK